LSASASDPDGHVTKVEFFQDGASIGEDSTAPYGLAVTGLDEGTYDFVARATDNGSPASSTDSAAVRITVGPPNHIPIAAAQSISTAEDTPLPITLMATDADGDALEFSIVTPPTHGTLVMSCRCGQFRHDYLHAGPGLQRPR